MATRNVAITLYRSGNASHSRLSNIRTALTYKGIAFDYPVYQRDNTAYVSTEPLDFARLGDKGAQERQRQAFSKNLEALPPYGMSAFSVPYFAEYLWRLKVPVQIPAELAEPTLIHHKYYRLCLLEDMELTKAKELYRSIEGPPIWERVPKQDVPDVGPDEHYDWTNWISGPLALLLKDSVRDLRAKQVILKREGNVDESADIDNYIMELVTTGLSYSYTRSRIVQNSQYPPFLSAGPMNSTRFNTPQIRWYSTLACYTSAYHIPIFRNLLYQYMHQLAQERASPNTDIDRRADIDNELMEFKTFWLVK